MMHPQKTEGYDPQWVKTIDRAGVVTHINWVQQYEKLREATGTKYPGYVSSIARLLAPTYSSSSSSCSSYLLHEAVAFNPMSRQWFFFPRRVSKEPYDEVLDESRGSNHLLIASEDFSDVRVINNIGVRACALARSLSSDTHDIVLQPLDPNYGFSAVKLIPFRENEFVLLKTTEVDGVNTVMMVIDIRGHVLMDQIDVGNVKFEGIEFL